MNAIEYGLIAAGVSVAILAVAHGLSEKKVPPKIEQLKNSSSHITILAVRQAPSSVGFSAFFVSDLKEVKVWGDF